MKTRTVPCYITDKVHNAKVDANLLYENLSSLVAKLKDMEPPTDPKCGNLANPENLVDFRMSIMVSSSHIQSLVRKLDTLLSKLEGREIEIEKPSTED